jgi:hypothetical protein
MPRLRALYSCSSSSLLMCLLLSLSAMSLDTPNSCMLLPQLKIFCPCSRRGSVAILPPFCLHAYSLPFLLIQPFVHYLYFSFLIRAWVLLSFFLSCFAPIFQLASHHCSLFLSVCLPLALCLASRARCRQHFNEIT